MLPSPVVAVFGSIGPVGAAGVPGSSPVGSVATGVGPDGWGFAGFLLPPPPHAAARARIAVATTHAFLMRATLSPSYRGCVRATWIVLAIGLGVGAMACKRQPRDKPAATPVVIGAD